MSTTAAPSGPTITGLQSSSAMAGMVLDERADALAGGPRAPARRRPVRRDSHRARGRSASERTISEASPALRGARRTETSRSNSALGAARAAGHHGAEMPVLDDSHQHLHPIGGRHALNEERGGVVAGGHHVVVHLLGGPPDRLSPRRPICTPPASVLWTRPGGDRLQRHRPAQSPRRAPRRAADRAHCAIAGAAARSRRTAPRWRGLEPAAPVLERPGEDRGRLVAADVLEDPRLAARPAAPVGVVGRAAQGARGVLGERVARHLDRAPGQRSGAPPSVMKTASTGMRRLGGGRSPARSRRRRPRRR